MEGLRAPLAGQPHEDGPTAYVDLQRYVPAYLTWTANKLSRGASGFYLTHFGVGIEVWRCLVLLAVDGACSAQQVSRVIGLDKASVSRCFKRMQEDGLIRIELAPRDGRSRIAVLTPRGRVLHDQIREVALARERALLAVLSPQEAQALLALLQRVHENLPNVEAATAQFLAAREAGQTLSKAAARVKK
ncbi:MarR family transcriptional regulator [Xenophilus arseniciresistens]|uniref:MarR family transcriptional regulator n=1 Tax=Xenophilus arseniciresistens TaxID=1283306 RepID=A0AAE3T0R8_9BURK|nr:MarR family transcriptional regulator [Xenophilus arseniciresistens]MDA7418399.1 MarR family transcriptional regulator [Xenophilus arseniciresistens]